MIGRIRNLWVSKPLANETMAARKRTGRSFDLREIARQLLEVPAAYPKILLAEEMAGRLMVEAVRRGLWDGIEYLQLRGLISKCTTERPQPDYARAFDVALYWLRRNPDRVPFKIEWHVEGSYDGDLRSGCPMLAKIIEHAAAKLRRLEGKAADEAEAHAGAGQSTRPTGRVTGQMPPLLTEVQEAVLDIIKAPPSGKPGVTGPDIISILRQRTGRMLGQSTLTAHIIPVLKRTHGVKNERGSRGYYIPSN